MESVTQTRPRRSEGRAHRETCSREEVQETQWEVDDQHSDSPQRTDFLSRRKALEAVLGTSPRTIWCALNWCLPALLLVSIFFTYLAWNDKLVRLMFLGFIALTVVFWVLLNWVLMQVLPPEKDD